MDFKTEIEIPMKVINAYIGNVNLVKKNLEFGGNAFDEIYDQAPLEYKPYVKDVLSFQTLSEFVLKPCIDICYFNDRPLKVMRYIKWHLSKYAFKDYLREVMIEVLEDSNRINPIIGNDMAVKRNISYLIDEIKKLDFSKPYKFEMVENITVLEYFNDGRNFYEDAKRFMKIWMSIEGLITPEKEQHENYINENFGPALVEAIEKSKIAAMINRQPVSSNSAKSNKESDPIIWQGSNVQIAYLFKELQSAHLIPSNINLWELLEKHFVDNKGKPLKNLAQSYDGMINSKSGKPKNSEAIISIVEKTKKQ